jgi:hypothetical protein
MLSKKETNQINLKKIMMMMSWIKKLVNVINISIYFYSKIK